MEEAFNNYLSYFETLSPGTVGDLRDLATDDFHFKDPFNEVRSVDAVLRIFEHMFKQVRDPKFSIVSSARKEDTMYVLWDFTFSSRLLEWGKPQRIRGMSVVKVNNEQRVCSHIDYWDASTEIYMKVPVIGFFIKLLRRFAA